MFKPKKVCCRPRLTLCSRNPANLWRWKLIETQVWWRGIPKKKLAPKHMLTKKNTKKNEKLQGMLRVFQVWWVQKVATCKGMRSQEGFRNMLMQVNVPPIFPSFQSCFPDFSQWSYISVCSLWGGSLTGLPQEVTGLPQEVGNTSWPVLCFWLTYELHTRVTIRWNKL